MKTAEEILAEIAKREDSASRGPWRIGHVDEFGGESAEICDRNGLPVCVVTNRRDQALIASSREDIPRMWRALRIALDTISESVPLVEAGMARDKIAKALRGEG